MSGLGCVGGEADRGHRTHSPPPQHSSASPHNTQTSQTALGSRAGRTREGSGRSRRAILCCRRRPSFCLDMKIPAGVFLLLLTVCVSLDHWARLDISPGQACCAPLASCGLWQHWPHGLVAIPFLATDAAGPAAWRRLPGVTIAHNATAPSVN